MIHQLNIYGNDKVEQSIQRLQTFEPAEGYYLAFSGGKDSCVIKALADMAGVKYDAHYTVTSVDPPELVRFIKRYCPDVSRDIPTDRNGNAITMWNLIPRHTMPPTRISRYCCEELKESRGSGRFVITGVRRAESVKRSQRGGLEVGNSKSRKAKREKLDPDNPDQEMIHNCMQHNARILNPIIDWSTDEVWEFIREYNVPYCELYDEGKKRLGCIGCPMGGAKQQREEFERWPTYRRAYLRAFDKMLQQFTYETEAKTKWKTAEDVMKWWLNEKETDG